MSKAFTREDAETPEPLPLPLRLEPGEKRLITADGYRAMQQELAQLLEERPALVALGSGLEALARLRDVDARIQVLNARLSQLTVADPPADEGRVYFGAYVTVRDGRGKTLRFRLVGPDEVDATRHFISVQSPLARALLGRSPGEVVDVELPRGDEELTVLSVSYH
ncbi:MAG: GreA/GreB family elongation factor [Myxococcota bacterium]